MAPQALAQVWWTDSKLVPAMTPVGMVTSRSTQRKKIFLIGVCKESTSCALIVHAPGKGYTKRF